MRVKLVAGNWKSNGSIAANARLLDALRDASARWSGAQCALCPPYPYLAQVRDALRGSSIAWGAQDVSRYGAGAYTGAVTADMLADLGCRYAIVGLGARHELYQDAIEKTHQAEAQLGDDRPDDVFDDGGGGLAGGDADDHDRQRLPADHRSAFPFPDLPPVRCRVA